MTPQQPPGRREALAERLRHLLDSRSNVRERAMFGGVSFMVDDRMAVAAGRDGDLLVRTDPAQYDDLMAEGAQPARMGPDRVMGRGWVTVPPERLEEDADLAYWLEIGMRSRSAAG